MWLQLRKHLHQMMCVHPLQNGIGTDVSCILISATQNQILRVQLSQETVHSYCVHQQIASVLHGCQSEYPGISKGSEEGRKEKLFQIQSISADHYAWVRLTPVDLPVRRLL